MLMAARAANEHGVPVVLDPVGAGATSYRTASARRILDESEVAVLRGNAGEVATLVGAEAEVRGVESMDVGGDPADLAREAARTLDEASRRARLTVRFTGPDATAIEPQADGVDGALGRLLAIVARGIDAGTWQRLKACPAETCQWAFYDASRNRSAVWCDMRVCGNRAKVRGYRERHSSA
jgi:hydroxyethylthiazole kinase-like sugar kinase family protein